MNILFSRITATLLCASLSVGFAAPLSGAEDGSFDPATILAPAPPVVVDTQAFNLNRIVSTQTGMIRHEATTYQRKVALARARAYMSKQRRVMLADAKPTSKPSTKTAGTSEPSKKTSKTTEPAKKPSKVTKSEPSEPSKPSKTAKTGDTTEPSKTKKIAKTEEPSAPTPKKQAPQKEEPKVVAAPQKKLPRYIAVDTVKDERSGPKVKKVIMLFDTQSEAIVGNQIYDLESPPAVGKTARFETYSAEYVGAGL